EYTGKEDEIIKKIEAGNVSLPLTGTLIQGSQNLFGLKTELQFGRLTVTTVFSQQKGKSKVIEVQGGAQRNDFELTADNYEGNKHYFLAHYFKDAYDDALKNLPLLRSDIKITKIEVWVTNKSGDFENSRNIIAFLDLGESGDNIFNEDVSPLKNDEYPRNDNNILGRLQSNSDSSIRKIESYTTALAERDLNSLKIGKDFEKLENARMLSPNEYKLNTQLGYISLNSALNADEILAVAFQYQINGEEEPVQVGEFSTDGINDPKMLIVKLLKGTNFSPRFPNWDLMMKNVYALGAYQINNQDFVLNILYRDDETGNEINYLPEERLNRTQIIGLLELDNVDARNESFPDGRFDFIESVTINPSNGRIYFPMREPFAEGIRRAFVKEDLDPIGANKYMYNELYDSTQTRAKQIAEKNKFIIRGSYQSSSSSEIPLNAINIPKGGVKVTAGGRELTENIEYTVDYNLGRVTIIDQGLLESGTPIRISLESNELFNFQTKTMIGSHLNYKISDDFNVGATVLNLTERPLTTKVNMGDEPISNTIWGLNASYRTESRYITKLIDKIPLIETKEPSNVSMVAEFAHLIPGHSKAIEDKGTVKETGEKIKEEYVYIDDFEGTKTTIDLKNFPEWNLSSTPQFQPELFPEAELMNDPAYGYNRARIAWYFVDHIFYKDALATPTHLRNDDDARSNLFIDMFNEDEIFPNREIRNNIRTPQPILNVAFYPSEKGPYNYDLYGEPGYSSGIHPNGRLRNPQERWGGMMRDLRVNDFEAANIEYIEFWMMDPFVEGHEQDTGGYLYFNLGNISEDILRDSRKSLEHGLPKGGGLQNIDTTVWGRVTRFQPREYQFANDPAARKNQDVGLDGMTNKEEKKYFADYYQDLLDITGIDTNNVNSDDIEKLYLINDISNDDYHFFRGTDYDKVKLGVLERYKRYNGHDGNSPSTQDNPESYPTAGKALPDAEDINLDYTLSEAESYFQYMVSIKKEEFIIGQNYITDTIRVKAKLYNDDIKDVTWYQFKIPLADNERIGEIDDFKSIRFFRMFLTGFRNETILRFATLDLVRSDWRKYQYSMYEGREFLSSPQLIRSHFEVSAVNIEENGKRSPVNYILPPGVQRERDPYQIQSRQLNEQSIVLKVLDLEDGDAKAAFKNIYLDMRKYKRMQMYVHAESIEKNEVDDEDLTAFIRLGTDYKDNYYEYEIPLQMTKEWDLILNENNPNHRLEVWPDSNKFDIDLDLFLDAKQKRNDQLRKNPNMTVKTIFKMMDPKKPGAIIKVRGNPNLSNVRTIMIGVRNPYQTNDRMSVDDGQSKSAEIWMNELRLTDFDEKGGWAANGRVTTKLADLGMLTLAGNTSTPGFGSIEKKIDERQKEQISQVDVSGSLELGKFFPEKSNVMIPMYAGYSYGVVNPQYNPLDPDIPMDITLDNAANKEERQKIKDNTQDQTVRRNINFTNVKVNKQSKKPRLYDPANFSVSYGYSETMFTSFSTAYRLERNERMGFNYNYNLRPKNISPLSKSKILKSPLLRLVRDFNFYYLPSNISFRTDLDWDYYSERLKNINSIEDYSNIEVVNETRNLASPTFKPDMSWNRFFDFKYDLTRSLKLDFSSTNRARIDGFNINNIDDNQLERYQNEFYSFEPHYDDWKGSIKYSIFNKPDRLIYMGRNLNYNHSLNVTYSIPINKLPLLDWTSSSIRYNATYGWDAGPRNITVDDEETGLERDVKLGNTIKNSNSISLNGQLNFLNLYNKVNYLKNVNQKFKQKSSGRKPPTKYKTVNYKQENVNFRANAKKNIYHRLNTEEVTVKVIDENGNVIEGELEVIDEKKIAYTTNTDIRNATINIDGKVEDKDNVFRIITDYTARLAMSTRNVSLSYSNTNGSVLPGYVHNSGFLGRDANYNSPTWGYVFGEVPDTNTLKEKWIENKSWFTNDPYFNDSYTFTHKEDYNARATIEPIEGLRIDLNANRSESRNTSGEYYFMFDSLYNNYDWHYNPSTESGNFSMSYISIKTFKLGTDLSNTLFLSMRDELRELMSQRHYARDNNLNNTSSGEYADGYGELSQQVLIPSLLAAYTGRDPEKIFLDPMPKLSKNTVPLPNWRINYDGLSKKEFFKKYFRTINIGHTYRSSYNVSSYKTNLRYRIGENNQIAKDSSNNFQPQFEIASVSITEQFSPLINLDLTWKNNLITRIEYKQNRAISLSLTNNQVTEVIGNEVIFGSGYRFEDVEIIFNSRAGQTAFKSDLNL
ncbi:cell surface protein SprA, partial [Bacteroidota bacterium]